MISRDEPSIMLNYGQADQGLFRAVRERIDVVIVPGTIATYFREGTGGFVLTLRVPYLIDPRTPILQYGIPFTAIRASHESLANAYGEEFLDALISSKDALALPHDLWLRASRRIAEFQRDYAGSSASKADKYLRLLGEQRERPFSAPAIVLPAYLMAESSAAGRAAWSLSMRMLESAREAVPESTVAGVAALRSVDSSRPAFEQFDGMLGDLIADGVSHAFFWLNDFRERSIDAGAVAALALTLRKHAAIRLYNLYGGFLSLALREFGVAGVASGIGYSDSRSAVQLYETGPVRPRYYHPGLHAYMNVDVAEFFMQRAAPELRCGCEICSATGVDGVRVGLLDTRSLMLHFVAARHRERQMVLETSVGDLAETLRVQAALAAEAVAQLPVRLVRQVPYRHLSSWSEGLRRALAS